MYCEIVSQILPLTARYFVKLPYSLKLIIDLSYQFLVESPIPGFSVLFRLPAMLARSLDDVSHANNNRFAVVICFYSALRASEMLKRLKFFSNFVPS